MKRFMKDDVYNIVYESVGDFFTNTDMDNPPATMHPKNQGQLDNMIGDSDWRYGDEESKDGFHTTRFDPKKGKDMCLAEVKKTMADKKYKDLIRQARTYRKRIEFTDHGFRLNVPKALSGEDRYFGVYKNARKPVVKIAINICGSACVDQESFRKVAATAIPTIHALEQAGIATEVWYCSFSTDTYRDPKVAGKYCLVHAKIKSAQERFNWTTFAPVFTLGSFRESVFLAEIFSEFHITSGLGRPMDDSDIKKKDNFGYTAVIGLNAVGPVKQVNSIFEQLHKTKS